MPPRLPPAHGLLTKGQEDVRQFTADHVTVFGLVVQFQTLDEIFVHSVVLVLQHLRVDRIELLDHQFLFALLLGTAHFLDGGQSRVHLQSTEEVADVVSVHTLVGAVVDSPNEVYTCGPKRK